MLISLYLRCGLSPRQYSGIDQAILRRIFPTVSASGSTPSPEPAIIPVYAVNHALFRLLVALGDQQLALGLSLAVAVYVRLAGAAADFSVYSFRVAVATMWQACLTHMCAMAALRDDFCSQRGSKWRLVAMGALLVLLAPLLLLSRFPSFVFEPRMSVKCACGRLLTYEGGHNASFVLQSVLLLMLVLGGYGRRVVELVRPRRTELERGNWLTELFPSEEEAVVVETEVNLRKGLALAWLERPRPSLRGIWLFYRLAVGELKRSFLYEIIWLAFYYSFGITSLVVTWTILSPLSQWSLSFGQLAPLALLVMCLMPLYDDYRGKYFTSFSHVLQMELSETKSISRAVEPLRR